MNLAAIAIALSLSAEVGPVTMWHGASDPSGACKVPPGGERIVKTPSGKTFACASGTWVDRSDTGKSYDLLFSFPGTMSNGQVLSRIVVPRAFTIPVGCTGSVAKPATNPSSTTSITLKQNGTTVGTISIATNGAATFTCAAPIAFSAGDILTVNGPATANATLADLALTLVGVIS